MGFQPRNYWDDPDASEPVDVDLEAAGLSLWADGVRGVSVSAAQIRPRLAEDVAEDAHDDFVEETVMRLLELLRLSPPDAVPGAL